MKVILLQRRHVVWAAREEFAQNIEDVLGPPGEDAISGCPLLLLK